MRFPVLWLSFMSGCSEGDIPRMRLRVPFVYHLALLCKSSKKEGKQCLILGDSCCKYIEVTKLKDLTSLPLSIAPVLLEPEAYNIQDIKARMKRSKEQQKYYYDR